MPERSMFSGMFLEHPFGQERSTRAATLACVEQEWEKKAGFGPVVLLEVCSQPGKGEVELRSDRFTHDQAI